MGVASIIAGIAAFLFTFGGLLFTFVPILGTLLSFGAPLVAIAGIVMGGLGMSRAKREGMPTGAPTAGLIISIVALIPALVVAVTCGLCNACFTAGTFAPRPDGSVYYGDPYAGDWPDDLPRAADAGGAAAAPVEPTGPPTQAELDRMVFVMNDVCANGRCEGEFDYRFERLTCDGTGCKLAFQAKHWEAEEYVSAEVEVPIPEDGRIVECVGWELRGGVPDVCTERGATEAFGRAVDEALDAWERQNLPPRPGGR